MKKWDIDRLIVGFSCGNLEAEGITISIDIQDGTIHFEFLGIGSDVTESGRNISLKGACFVSPVCLGTIDLIQIPTAQCIDRISTNVRTRKVIPGSVA